MFSYITVIRKFIQIFMKMTNLMFNAALAVFIFKQCRVGLRPFYAIAHLQSGKKLWPGSLSFSIIALFAHTFSKQTSGRWARARTLANERPCAVCAKYSRASRGRREHFIRDRRRCRQRVITSRYISHINNRLRGACGAALFFPRAPRDWNIMHEVNKLSRRRWPPARRRAHFFRSSTPFNLPIPARVILIL